MRLRTVLLSAFLLMTMTLGANGDGTGADVDAILKGVIDGGRRVLALSSFSNQSLAIVSASKDVNLNGAAVVDITLSGKKVLFNSAVLLKDKWPTATLPNGNLALVADDTGFNLLIDGNVALNNGQLLAMSFSSPGTVNQVKIPSRQYGQAFNGRALVSAHETMTVYSVSQTTPTQVSTDQFSGKHLPNSTDMLHTSGTSLSGNMVCKAGEGEFTLQSTVCPDGRKIHWDIASGFASQVDTFLIDFTHRNILTFTGHFKVGEPISLTTIAFVDFWGKGTSSGPKQVTSDNVNPQKTSVSSTLPSKSHTLMFIIIGVVLVLLLIGAVAAFLYFRGSSKNGAKQASETGDGPDDTAIKKATFGNQIAPEKGKASKLAAGGKRRTSKGSPSKRRASSGKLASPRGRRASGRVPSPRRSGLKPASKGGRRVSSGKAASRRRSKG